MNADLLIAPEAEQDIGEAFLWYESRRAGLGEDFLSSVEACLERVRRQPLLYRIVHENYRRSLTRRFPFAVFFELVDTTVTVYAVFHTSRDPEKWRRRLI